MPGMKKRIQENDAQHGQDSFMHGLEKYALKTQHFKLRLICIKMRFRTLRIFFPMLTEPLLPRHLSYDGNLL